jgi:DegV family protein with EDD domain
MDYMMPDMNGAEVLREIRRQPNGLCRDCPVILLTANSAQDASRIVKDAGFDQFIEKPIKVDLLEQELLKFLPDTLVEQRSEAPDDDGEESLFEAFSRRKHLCITSDSVSDLPRTLLDRLDIKVVSLYIRTNKGRFADTREIDSDNMQQYMTDKNSYARADSLSMEEYEQFYADRLTEAENVIHISMAERSGRSYGVAVAAATGFDHVHVIDSGHISCGEGLLALYAAQLVRDGLDTDEVIEKVNSFKTRIRTHFMMPNANVFYQNGYTNRLTAKLVESLHAHPSLTMRRSRITINGIFFGSLTSAWRRFIRVSLMNKASIDTSIVYITYTNLTAQQLEFIRKEILKQVPFAQVIMQKTSFSTACNAGVKTMGFSYLKKE